MKTSVNLFIFVFLLIFSLPKAVVCQVAKSIDVPIQEGKARIIFTRHSNFFGMIVPHQIIDKGTGIDYNTIVLQKKVYPPEKSNFDKARNVTLLCLRDTQFIFKYEINTIMESSGKINGNANFSIELDSFLKITILPHKPTIIKHIIADTIWGVDSLSFSMFFGDSIYEVKNKIEKTFRTSLSKIPTSKQLNFEYFNTLNDPIDINVEGEKKQIMVSDLWSMKANALLVNENVMSGETVFWDRNPGLVRLEVITPAGDQAFTPPFQVIAGKTYKVDYYYMKAKFEISEE